MAELTKKEADELVAQGRQLPRGWGYSAQKGAHKLDPDEKKAGTKPAKQEAGA